MKFSRISSYIGLFILFGIAWGCSATKDDGPTPIAEATVVNHMSIVLKDIPATWIDQAKQKLRIAYGTTSHGSQLVTGWTGLSPGHPAAPSIPTTSAGPAVRLTSGPIMVILAAWVLPMVLNTTRPETSATRLGSGLLAFILPPIPA